jgi:biofilm PGA synthesis lipoprotein PgaB
MRRVPALLLPLAAFLVLAACAGPAARHSAPPAAGSVTAGSDAAGSVAAKAAVEWPPDSFAVICFHDVQDELISRPDFYTITTRDLTVDFAWLREHDYHVVSLDEIIASRRDHRPLPPRAVLLSFDDGLESAYTRVYPLLEAFHYPAIVGLVGSWLIESPNADSTVRYGDTDLPRGDFLSAAQIREMAASGLIEFASHTFGLHRGIVANPQQNLEPAATARLFDGATGQYESSDAYAKRVREDLTRNSAAILQLTGKRPRVVVWPYGAHNQKTDEIARDLGMPYGLTLQLDLNTPDVPLNRMRRILVTHDFTPADFADRLQEPTRAKPVRVMQVDLDFVYDADPHQQEANLSALLDRVKAMGVNTVYLQAFADPGGTGTAQALYFPNRRLPMRADLFNRVAWQLRTRTGVAVYAWLPLLAYALPATDPAHGHWVTAIDAHKAGNIQRLSPFDPRVREAVRDIYQDLGNGASFQGVLFSDDATLNDFEDAGPAALDTYREWGLPADVAAIRADQELSAEWARKKTEYLTAFSLELVRLVKADHDDLATARNLFASVAMDPQSEAWMGQSLDDALHAYDYVALMAMPYLEAQRSHTTAWLLRLVADVRAHPDGLAKTVFELQGVDWARNNRRISDATLVEQINALRRAGVQSFGYYPDDFINGRPSLDALRPVLSLKSQPGGD